MTTRNRSSVPWNPWKLATIGMAVVFATALITGVVVAHYAGKGTPEDVTNPVPVPDASGMNQVQGTGTVNPPAGADASVPPPPPPRHEVPPPPQHDQVARAAPPRPSGTDVEECNRYATAAGRDKTSSAVSNGLLGAAIGAGLGAAGGAIAGGGSGAGKGAGIGGLVGAAAGTLYGLNDANKSPDRIAAYRACMRRRGNVE